MRKKKPQVVWRCEACKLDMNYKKFLKHAESIHGVDIKK